MEKTDTLLLVGTAFYTSLARTIVYNAISQRLQIIEVNKELQLNKVKWITNLCQIQG